MEITIVVKALTVAFQGAAGWSHGGNDVLGKSWPIGRHPHIAPVVVVIIIIWVHLHIPVRKRYVWKANI